VRLSAERLQQRPRFEAYHRVAEAWLVVGSNGDIVVRDSEVKPSELNQLGLACLHNIKPINKHE